MILFFALDISDNDTLFSSNRKKSFISMILY